MSGLSAIHGATSDAANVWTKQSDGHRALWDANAGLRLNPISAELHYRAGVAHKLLEDYDYAKVEFLLAYCYDLENSGGDLFFIH
ncbi:hypothetical protein Dimus_001540 [Dionaea muscipula]